MADKKENRAANEDLKLALIGTLRNSVSLLGPTPTSNHLLAPNYRGPRLVKD